MDAAAEDEKKPFDNEAPEEDTAEPDPNEELMLESGGGRAWMVKMPKSLLTRWSSIQEDNIHLATMRIYNDVGPKPRIFLFLPPNHDPNSTASPPPLNNDPNRPQFSQVTHFASDGLEPDVFELDMVNESVENHLVVAERPLDPSFRQDDKKPVTTSSRARTTILTGRIKHECNLRPGFSPGYRKLMRERHRKANVPTRTIKMIEEAGVAGGQGGINRLSSGVGIHSGGAFSDLIKTKAKPAKGNFERMTRMPKNQLYDLLFQLFRENSFWGFKALRERTQQPEAYLKEILNDIAFLHRSGEHNGNWELKDNFAKGEAKPDIADSPEDVKPDIDEDEDLDDDEDEDMEEVS